jgi:hypothetical protein
VTHWGETLGEEGLVNLSGSSNGALGRHQQVVVVPHALGLSRASMGPWRCPLENLAGKIAGAAREVVDREKAGHRLLAIDHR